MENIVLPILIFVRKTKTKNINKYSIIICSVFMCLKCYSEKYML